VRGSRTRRTLLAAALFALLIAGAFRPELLRLLIPPHRMPYAEGPLSGIDRSPLRLRNDGTPDELRVFLNMARMQTRPGKTVSLILAPPHNGFSYAYWRANYELTGRQVLLPPEHVHPAAADYVVVWRAEWSDPAFREVWRGFGGMVLEHR
jgi:hypothetical protein